MHPTLLERIAAGEPGAVDACMERYRALVWSLARRHLRQHADAEDAVQDIFVAVWRSAARFDPAVASEATFISMIAPGALSIGNAGGPERSPSRASSKIPWSSGKTTRIMSMLRKEQAGRGTPSRSLRADQRQVLELSLLQGMSQSQIARTVDLPLGTVKTHARRGLLRLREMLAANSAATMTGDAR